MRKTLIAAFFMFLVLGMASVSATPLPSPPSSLVAGVVYDMDNQPVPGAEVTVTCNDIVKETVTLSDGSYAVKYFNFYNQNEQYCVVGDTAYVLAEKDEASGSNSGSVNNFIVVKMAVVNVQIPEFSEITAGIALLGAGAVFLILRRK